MSLGRDLKSAAFLMISMLASFGLSAAETSPSPLPSLTPATSPSPLSQEEMEKIRSTAKDIGQTKTLGTWTGGGGNGVSCPDYKKLDQIKNLLPSDIDKYRVIKSADLWVFEKTVFGIEAKYIEPQAGETADAYLSRIIESRIKPLNPVFAERITDALQWINQAPWNSVKGVRKINDSDLAGSVPTNCKPIQLVARYFKSNPPQKPEVFFDVDSDLVAQLGDNLTDHVLNVAALKLHEALYMLAVETGQQDSDRTMEVVGLLLSDKLNDILDFNTPAMKAAAFRAALANAGFDLVATLYGPGRPAPEHGPYSVETRRNSYKKLRKVLQTSAENWFKSKGLKANDITVASIYDPAIARQWQYEIGQYFAQNEVPHLNDEVVFLDIAVTLPGSEDFESLLSNPEGKSVVRSFCLKMRLQQFKVALSNLFSPSEPARDAMWAKALNYCNAEQLDLSKTSSNK
jgi:hypothetical protein